MIGVGLGCIFKSGGTSGGSDIIAMLVIARLKVPKVNLAKIIFCFDMGVIELSAIVYKDIASALYGALVSFIYTQIANKILMRS